MSTSKADEMLEKAGMGVPATTTVPAMTTEVVVPETTIPSSAAPETTSPAGGGPETTSPAAGGPETTNPAAGGPETTAPSNEAIEAHLRSIGVLKDGETLESLKKPASPDDEATAKKAKVDNAFKYALENGLFKKEEYDQFVLDSARDKREIALDVFKSHFLEDIKGTEEEGTYNDQDIEAMFERRNYSEKEIDRLSGNFFNQKYSHLQESNIVSKFDEHQAEIQSATNYKGIVESVISTLPSKLNFNIGEVNVDYVPSQEAIESIRELYSNPKAFKAFSGEITADSLSEAAKTNIIMKDLNKVIAEVALSYHAAMMGKVSKGRQGIDPVHRQGDGGAGASTGISKTPNADAKLKQKS